MKIKWLGWSSFIIHVDDKVIYMDPFFSEDEEKADIILVSQHFS